jgi:hypothetical protein
MAGRYAASEITDTTHTPHIGRHADVKPSGRRKAQELPADHPANTGPLHRKGKKRVSGVGIGLAATGAMSVAAGAIPMHTDMTPIVHQGMIIDIPQEPITAATTVIIQPRVEVSTIAAPPPPEPVAIVEAPAPKIEYTPAPPPPPQPVVIVPPPPVQPPQVANPGAAARQAIVNAAYAQIGVWQDCTMLVTNSLRAIGINFHDWPIGYFTLGYQVSRLDALPGDLVYYRNGGGPGSLAHIAVYAGNGRAVHGGFNGNQTVEFSVDVGSGPVFIRVT